MSTPLLRETLCRLLQCCPHPGLATVLRYRLVRWEPGVILLTVDPEGATMLLMTTTQKSTLSLDPRDSKGNPAPLDGIPVWTVADPSLVTLNIAADGLSAEVLAAGPVGTTQVNVTADARIGPEIREIQGALDVQISPAEAVTLGIASSTPVEQ